MAYPGDLISRTRLQDPGQPDFGLSINTFKTKLSAQYLIARNNQSAMVAQEFLMLLAAINAAAIQPQPSMNALMVYLAERQNNDPLIVKPIQHVLATNAAVQETINNFLTGLATYSAQLDNITYKDILRTTLITLPYTFNVSTLPDSKQ
jgi:hypothetical protein